MIRLHVAQPLSAGASLPLAPDQARYLLAVMRRTVGDAVLLFNGRDGEWRARLVEAGKRGVVVEAESLTREQALGPDLDLMVALVKRGPLETIVEKAAELGARRVRLLVTRRTRADGANIARLRTIAIEAAEQTGRLDVPEVLPPEKLDRLLDGWEAGRALVFCDEAGEAPPMLEALGRVAFSPGGGPAPGSARGGADVGSGGDRGPSPAAILIGPEGGFDPSERERLRGLDFVTPVSLGPRILRADTAAIGALALWQAAAGDWRAG